MGLLYSNIMSRTSNREPLITTTRERHPPNNETYDYMIVIDNTGDAIKTTRIAKE